MCSERGEFCAAVLSDELRFCRIVCAADESEERVCVCGKSALSLLLVCRGAEESECVRMFMHFSALAWQRWRSALRERVQLRAHLKQVNDKTQKKKIIKNMFNKGVQNLESVFTQSLLHTLVIQRHSLSQLRKKSSDEFVSASLLGSCEGSVTV